MTVDCRSDAPRPHRQTRLQPSPLPPKKTRPLLSELDPCMSLGGPGGAAAFPVSPVVYSEKSRTQLSFWVGSAGDSVNNKRQDVGHQATARRRTQVLSAVVRMSCVRRLPKHPRNFSASRFRQYRQQLSRRACWCWQTQAFSIEVAVACFGLGVKNPTQG